ncbi:hypothetical protein ABEF90_12970 [Acinetobacter thermotolerans]|uniref:type IV pilus assembly protein FimV n=1 Tax=Acinetobacter thermotolerans TaxID=3151487 RepID=UPI00325B0DB1
MPEPRIKMTVYNKFKITILAIMIAQPAFAITVEPVQVQSAPGELLYAEINFRQADINIPIEVSLATPEDLLSMGTTHQPPGHLNFFTRRSSNGTGVITITSSRPITDRDLNFVVKIKQGNAARLQHVKTSLRPKTDLLKAALGANERPLTPVVVVNEKEIDLNLPVSTQYQVSNNSKTVEKPLAVQRQSPPPLSLSSIPQKITAAPVTAEKPLNISPQTAPTTVAPLSVAQPAPTAAFVAAPVTPAPQVSVAPSLPVKPADKMMAQAETAATAQAAPKTVTETQAPTATPTKAEIPAPTAQSTTTKPAATQLAVAPQSQSSDPLVKKYQEQLAAAKQEMLSTKPAQTETPMHQAKPATPRPVASPSTAKATYVVQSNESLWKIAARIAQQQNRGVGEVMQQIKKNNEHAFIGGDANRLRRGAALNLDTTLAQKQPVKVNAAELAQAQAKPKGPTKYRLNQAEMSLIAENQKESTQLSANQNTVDRKTSKELSLKVMTAREKTVKLQRNVTELELALNQKDQKIQLLNARLAQLQQQLKAHQAAKKAN